MKKKYLLMRVRTVRMAEFVECEGETYNAAIDDTKDKRAGDSRIINDSSTICSAIYDLDRADESWKRRKIRES